jgi:hypothetical protein
MDNFYPSSLERIFGDNIDLVISTVPVHSDEYHLLKKNGFFRMPAILMLKKLPFIIKELSVDVPAGLSDFKKWFLTFGDYDIF